MRKRAIQLTRTRWHVFIRKRGGGEHGRFGQSVWRRDGTRGKERSDSVPTLELPQNGDIAVVGAGGRGKGLGQDERGISPQQGAGRGEASGGARKRWRAGDELAAHEKIATETSLFHTTREETLSRCWGSVCLHGGVACVGGGAPLMALKSITPFGSVFN